MKNQKTPFVILGLLTIKPMSGYDMKKIIDKSIGHFWSESNGQLYPSLRQLVQEKYVVLEQAPHKGKKVCHLYSITDAGRAALQSWLAATAENRTVHRDEELLKLFFGTNSSPKASITLLSERQKRYQQSLDQYRSVKKEIDSFASSLHYVYWTFNVQNGILSAEAEIRWCQESIKALSNM